MEGLISVGGRMDAATLKMAYARGIFPWPQEGLPLLWFSPDPRGVLDFNELHIPKSLAKSRRRYEGQWRFTMNQAFAQVMSECRVQKRPGQDGTWILPAMIPAYTRLFSEGHALSAECWEGEELIGGIYGVLSKDYFSGESMFHKRSEASKLSLLFLIEHLKQRGFTWMDVQMVTPVLESLGGKYISRTEFYRRLAQPEPSPLEI